MTATDTAGKSSPSNVATLTTTVPTPPPVQSTGLNFSNGFGTSASGLTLNGSATVSDGTLLLTPATPYLAGSAFSSTPVPITSFSTNFQLQFTDPVANGMTFTIEGNSATALGQTGVDLGYGSPTGALSKSVAIKFDLYTNNGESPDSTGLYTDGARPFGAGESLGADGVNLHSGHPIDVSITYDGTTLRVAVTDTVTGAEADESYTVDIPSLVGGSTAYVGFTAATGGYSAAQQVASWTFTPGNAALEPPLAPSGLVATASSPTTATLTWTAVGSDATSVLVQRQTGGAGAFTTIATLAANSTTYNDTTLTPGTTYAYRVLAANTAGTSGASSIATITTPAASQSLPEPWSDLDIGATAAAGSASETNGVFTVSGSGADIYGTADAFHFASQPLSGNGVIIAQITYQQFTDQWAKAGVMIRASDDPSAPFVDMMLSGGYGVVFQSRATSGGESVSTQGPRVCPGLAHAGPFRQHVHRVFLDRRRQLHGSRFDNRIGGHQCLRRPRRDEPQQRRGEHGDVRQRFRHSRPRDSPRDAHRPDGFGASRRQRRALVDPDIDDRRRLLRLSRGVGPFVFTRGHAPRKRDLVC